MSSRLSIVQTWHIHFATVKYKEKQSKKKEREKRKKAEMMSLCHMDRFTAMHCTCFFAGASLGADTVKPLLSLFSYFSVYPPNHHHPPAHHSPYHLSYKIRNHLIPNKNRKIKRNPANVTPPTHTHRNLALVMITSVWWHCSSPAAVQCCTPSPPMV